MTQLDLLVVGAGPAAHAAAGAYRQAGGAGTVALLAPEGRSPYRRPPLSKELLRGELEDDGLTIEDDGWFAARRIELCPDTAVALDVRARRVELADGRALSYGNCVLATGAQPVRPSVSGADLDGVYVLRSAEDALALRAAAVAGARAVVVGAGFIGCEAAVSLRARGCSVELLCREPAPQAQRLGPDIAARLADWLEQDGVAARYDTGLEAIERDGAALRVRTSGGAALGADLVLLASGVRPASDLGREAGLAVAVGGEVAADEAMRTSAEGVLACGDCCRAHNAAAGRPLHVEHWGDALAQGEVAGIVAAGGEARWEQVPGFWATIGGRTIKHAAWGDGFEDVRVDEHAGGGFTAWYGRGGTCVGVLAYRCDGDYERGRALIERGGSCR